MGEAVRILRDVSRHSDADQAATVVLAELDAARTRVVELESIEARAQSLASKPDERVALIARIILDDAAAGLTDAALDAVPAANTVVADYAAARNRVTALVSAGQYLADVLRAGSTGNNTASLLGALERWEAARDAVPGKGEAYRAGRDGEAHPPGPRAGPPQRNTDSGAVGG